jgi:hypothetical protein
MFNIFEIDAGDKVRQIGPEPGFADEASALAYARMKAEDFRSSSLYAVSNSNSLSVFRGRGIRPPASAGLTRDRSICWDDPEEDVLEEAA